MSYLYKAVLISLSFFILGSCASEEPESSGFAMADEPLEKVDPNSAALYPSKKKTKAKDFTVTLTNGEQFQLSEYRGRVVIMNIWATWCAPCHAETPDFVDFYNEYKDKGLTILGVSVDEQGKSVVQPFIEKYNVTYPMVIDKDNTIMDKYGPTMGIPTSYIIDKEGNLRYFALGALTQKELKPKVDKLLSETTSES
ncbi:MAG: TlpA disulfide reductase family protein [Balneolaceae bacterium]|nr:TlpA disulfide reductase family protein [Balneolaceae bacterium]